jgi:acetyl-CoA acyltransferase
MKCFLGEIQMNNPVVINAVRTPVGRALKGTLVNFRPDDLAAIVIKAIIERTPALKAKDVDDVIMGCAMPEGEQGMNVANISKFAAGLPFTVPAMTINRFCSSGLQSIVIGADSIAAGRNEIVIAGGTESMTMIPMGGHKISPNPDIVDTYPEVYMSMGLTAERVAEKYSIKREDQDRFSYESHMKAVKAIKDKKFDKEIVPIEFDYTSVGKDNKRKTEKVILKMDEGPRADTNMEALTKLKPVFKQDGTVTAGTSSQMSDGAACVLIMSEKRAKALNVKPMARLVGYAVAGVEPELMGIGPVQAIPKVLKQTGIDIKDIGLIELNEAFAAQSLAVIKELKLDPVRINVNGGAIALGHPLGATGAILTVKLLNEMIRKKVKYGMVSMCIGGGMGAAGILENLEAAGKKVQKKKKANK